MSKPDDQWAGQQLGEDISPTVTIDSLPDAALVAEAETRKIVTANDAAGELFACPPSRLLGKCIEDLHPTETPDAATNYAEAIQRGCEGDRVNRLQNGQPFEIKTFDGERKPVEINPERILDGEYILGIIREATEQIEREQELRATATRLDTLLETLPLPVAVLTPDGSVTEWNQAAEAKFGYTADEVIGETYPLLTDDSEFEQLHQKVCNGKTLDGYKTVQKTKNDSHIDVKLYTRPLYEDGTLTGIIGASVDISNEQRRLQQLEVLQRTLRHNIRNKLNVIQGHLEVVEEEEVEDTTTSMEAAMTAADGILRRAETAKQVRTVDQHQEPPSQSISGLVNTVIDQYEDKDGVTIETHVGEASAKAVNGFSAAIEQAIENAVIHTESPVTVTVSIETMPDRIELLIEDNGKGIPEGELRAVNAAEETPLEHGSGIGLWSMKWLTEQSGGRFAVNSGPEGTTVSMQLLRLQS